MDLILKPGNLEDTYKPNQCIQGFNNLNCYNDFILIKIALTFFEIHSHLNQTINKTARIRAKP